MKHLPPTEAAILIGAVSDLDEFSRRAFPSGYGNAPAKRIVLDARDGVVACSPSRWLGYSLDSAAERMRVSRAYVALEKRGLVARVTGPSGQCRHLAPTARGKSLVADLLSREKINITAEPSISGLGGGGTAQGGPVDG